MGITQEQAYKLIKAINEYTYAYEQFSWKGSQPPDHFAYIEKNLKLKTEILSNLICFLIDKSNPEK